MHDWLEKVGNFCEIFTGIGQLVEEVSQGLEILVVLISLGSGSLNLFLEFTEWSSVS